MFRQILLIVCLVVWTQGVQAQLAAHVDVIAGPPTWHYTVFNDEAVGSPNYLGTFSVSVNAPITVTGTPTGWDFQTDNTSYVLWYNTDTILPYPHDIAPGDSLSGFEIEGIGAVSQTLDYGISAWDHIADAPGPSTIGSVLAPGIAVVPEPNGLLLFGMGAGTVLVLTRRRKGRMRLQ